MKTYLHILLALFLLTGCLEEEKINTTVQIALTFPERFAAIDKTAIEVTLSNVNNGMQYKTRCAPNGIATFNAEYGCYQASFQFKHTDEGVVNIFNGRVENIILSPGNGATHVSPFPMEIVIAQAAQVVIKEFYYYGCKGNDGKNYSSDTYLSLYNNTETVAYLDGLCIGMVSPMLSNSASKFMKEDGTLRDSLPLDQMAWQIPGSGKEHPLSPGETCIFAFSAINHKARHPNSVDLSQANYAFWTEEGIDMSSNMVQKPSIGVKHLTNIWRSLKSTKAFPINFTPKAMVTFRVEGQSASQYAANPENIKKAPGSTSSLLTFLFIPKEWILDGIECVTSAERAFKRLTTNVDAGFYFIPGGAPGCGRATIRKIQEVVDGRIVYEDTNNSSLDLDTTEPSLKNK